MGVSGLIGRPDGCLTRGSARVSGRGSTSTAGPVCRGERGEGAGCVAGGGRLLPPSGPGRDHRSGLPDAGSGDLTHGQVIEALVANRLTSPAPLVRVSQWAEQWAVEEVFGIAAERAERRPDRPGVGRDRARAGRGSSDRWAPKRSRRSGWTCPGCTGT